MIQFIHHLRLLLSAILGFVPATLDSSHNGSAASDMPVTSATYALDCRCVSNIVSQIVSESSYQCNNSQMSSLNATLGRYVFIERVIQFIKRIVFGS